MTQPVREDPLEQASGKIKDEIKKRKEKNNVVGLNKK